MRHLRLLPCALFLACQPSPAAPPASSGATPRLAASTPAAGGPTSTSAPVGSAQSAPAERPAIQIVDAPIPYGEERKRLTLEYIQEHYDPAATDITITPRVIIAHWTGGSSAKGTISTFSATRIESGRKSTADAGELNVSSQFVVDRDGTIYRLMPEDWMARHCIGLNRAAIGIENVGGIEGYPLTEAQVKANAALVRYLKAKYPEITHLIGHLEYRAFEGHPYFEERDPKYRNQKPDPGPEFMKKLRDEVKDLGLLGPPELEKPTARTKARK
jgi:N-acetylmuramoyl-L-alanine amidase